MNAPPQYRVRFANLEREAPCAQGETLYQCARRAGLRIVGACGGRGVCGSCMVRVESGRVQAAPGAQPVRGWQRACLLRPQEDCAVEISPRSIAAVVRAEVDGRSGGRLALAPAVRTLELNLAAPTLDAARADADRALEALRDENIARIDLQAARELSPALRAAGWRVQPIARGEELIGLRRAGAKLLGLAVDLGTTNVAGFLVDLESGARLASLGIENPQAGYGGDVVSRVNHATRSREGAAELQAAALAAIRALARDLCEEIGARTTDIADVAVCGNTAMHHLLLGLPVAQLGRVPFVPAVCEAIEVKARDLELPFAAGATLHALPNVGGFVGGDHVAVLLATEAQWSQATVLVLDIGTNTEISLVHHGEILTVSAPSGPALEGGHISCGMRAAEGAIERVTVAGDALELGVIGDAAPVGLCGSGVIDSLAALHASGRIDRRGRIRQGGADIVDEGGERALRLAEGVCLSQSDVRAVQLAKAAIRAGIDMLLAQAQIEAQAIERLLLAGAFGAYVHVPSAIAIGLLPRLPLERIDQVGNAAGVGVRMALASVPVRERARALARRCRHLELGALPGFQKIFIGRIGLEQ